MHKHVQGSKSNQLCYKVSDALNQNRFKDFITDLNEMNNTLLFERLKEKNSHGFTITLSVCNHQKKHYVKLYLDWLVERKFTPEQIFQIFVIYDNKGFTPLISLSKKNCDPENINKALDLLKGLTQNQLFTLFNHTINLGFAPLMNICIHGEKKNIDKALDLLKGLTQD
jgi:hypothetical protein